MLLGEDSKIAAAEALRDHVIAAQTERDFYKAKTVEARDELKDFALAAPPPVRPCSVMLKKVHYTVNFAQNVSLAHTAMQVGPIYLKTPLKVHIFGGNSEGVPNR